MTAGQSVGGVNFFVAQAAQEAGVGGAEDGGWVDRVLRTHFTGTAHFDGEDCCIDPDDKWMGVNKDVQRSSWVVLAGIRGRGKNYCR